jgi:hypothetical protein
VGIHDGGARSHTQPLRGGCGQGLLAGPQWVYRARCHEAVCAGRCVKSSQLSLHCVLFLSVCSVCFACCSCLRARCALSKYPMRLTLIAESWSSAWARLSQSIDPDDLVHLPRTVPRLVPPEIVVRPFVRGDCGASFCVWRLWCVLLCVEIVVRPFVRGDFGAYVCAWRLWCVRLCVLSHVQRSTCLKAITHHYMDIVTHACVRAHQAGLHHTKSAAAALQQRASLRAALESQDLPRVPSRRFGPRTQHVRRLRLCDAPSVSGLDLLGD